MKLREIFYAIGHHLFGHTPKPKQYPFEIRAQLLNGERVQFAQWMHPKAYPCVISEPMILQHQEYLKAGDVAIDIGAHSGDSTLPVAFAVGPQGSVLAFEANRYVFETLQKNAELNPEKTHIIPYNLAIAEKDGDYEFRYNDPGFMNGGNAESLKNCRHAGIFRQIVKGVNLFRFLQQNHPDLIARIRFIKIDAEGYDLAIAESISGLIDAQRPYIQIEVMKGTSVDYRKALFDFFRSRNYSLNHLGRTGRLLKEHEDILGNETIDLLCVPPAESGSGRESHPTAA